MPMDLVDSNYFLKPKTPLDHPWICQRNHLWCHIRMISLVFNPVVSTNSVNLLLKKSEKSLPKTPTWLPQGEPKKCSMIFQRTKPPFTSGISHGYVWWTAISSLFSNYTPIKIPFTSHHGSIPWYSQFSSMFFGPFRIETSIHGDSFAAQQLQSTRRSWSGRPGRSFPVPPARIQQVGHFGANIYKDYVYIYVCVSYIYMLGSITSYKHLPKMICPKMFGTVWTTVSMYCYLSKWGVTFLMLIETVLRVVIINKKHHKAQP